MAPSPSWITLYCNPEGVSMKPSRGSARDGSAPATHGNAVAAASRVPRRGDPAATEKARQPERGAAAHASRAQPAKATTAAHNGRPRRDGGPARNFRGSC
eukprot:CAMPEP_0117466748 /NCGR_PEP_ID=MMETSP0784-20121206/5302_1 /TAXON_ID=39447 /ORGANISM="" /LENGTH=99 /DNA_ID=CAMNT_0005260699 /DNA_START=419 /DNA_END=718 /DNA_ORIENTATION=-